MPVGPPWQARLCGIALRRVQCLLRFISLSQSDDKPQDLDACAHLFGPDGQLLPPKPRLLGPEKTPPPRSRYVTSEETQAY